MKYFKTVILSMFFLASGISFSSCGSGSGGESTDTQTNAYTSAYVCPMHCEGSGSKEPGNCPVCGMDYKKKEDHNADGHKHDEHKGHNH